MKYTSAVEWLAIYIKGITSLNCDEVIEQAKAMEKEQKIDFARHCLEKAKDLDILTSFMNVEQYYNETYNEDKQ